MAYCTAEQVLESLQWISEVPEFISGSTPSIEEVDSSGTLASGSEIFLDHNRVIASSLVLAYGASESSLTNLTLTTDYTFDADSGKITITAAGAVAIGSDSVYAREYKYIEIDGRTAYKESFITQKISSSQKIIDAYCQQSFDSPTQVVREQHYGKGRHSMMYRPYRLLPYILTPALGADLTAVATSVTLDSTSGLQANDYLSIGKEVVSIDSVDDSTTLTVTRGALGTTATTHSSGDVVVNVVVEASNDESGTEPSFDMQEYNKDWNFVADTGEIILHHSDITSDGFITDTYPKKYVPNRVNITYSYGRASVPDEVRDACIIHVAKQLMSLRVGKSAGEGSTEFTLGQAPQVLSDEITSLLHDHKLILGTHS